VNDVVHRHIRAVIVVPEALGISDYLSSQAGSRKCEADQIVVKRDNMELLLEIGAGIGC